MAIISSRDKFLLLKTNPEVLSVDYWFTVTGDVENGEKEQDAVRREIKEETELNITKIIPTDTYFEYDWPKGSGKMFRERLYLVRVSNKKVKLSDEHLDYKWLDKDSFIQEIYWEGNKSILRKAVEESLKP